MSIALESLPALVANAAVLGHVHVLNVELLELEFFHGILVDADLDGPLFDGSVD